VRPVTEHPCAGPVYCTRFRPLFGEPKNASLQTKSRGVALPRLTVVTISEAFSQFWSDLARDLDVSIDVVRPPDIPLATTDTAAIIVAAGGAEGQVVSWLESHAAPAKVPRIVVGTDPARRTAVQIIAGGASDYFAFPEDLEIFRSAVRATIQRRRPCAPSAGPDIADPFSGIIGESQALKKDLARAACLVPHRHARALIVGETGTGKELLARAIHAGGARRGAPFVAVNCSAFAENLIESELFGHERGSFTDAHAAKPGLFEIADCGTLFLDEVGALPQGVQAKLLRVLEDGEVRRVGGTKSRTVDVRIIAATNEPLSAYVRQGRFREDLFFRLSTVVLSLPPLRERGEDVLLIAQTLLEQLAVRHGLPVPSLTPHFRSHLQNHAWPGNVRELKNALERVLLLSPPGELRIDELLPPVQPTAAPEGEGLIPFPATFQEIATAAARATLSASRGNRTEAARRLGISIRRLRRMLNGEIDSEVGADRGAISLSI
jgi:DNA-binding NtrC family response regulator